MINPPSSELLRAFLTVATSRNLTRAADVLGRTQSAVSMQIKRLESDLDTTWRCCRTPTVEDSHGESNQLDGGMSKPSPARYRTMNWPSYTASLRKRGSLLIWLDKEMTRLAPPDGRPGRPAVFSDAAIQFCLTIKVLFKLPLRQTTGMVASLLKLADLDWAVARLHHPVPTAEDTGGPDPLPPGRWSAEPACGQHRDQVPRRWRVAGAQAWRSGATSFVLLRNRALLMGLKCPRVSPLIEIDFTQMMRFWRVRRCRNLPATSAAIQGSVPVEDRLRNSAPSSASTRAICLAISSIQPDRCPLASGRHNCGKQPRCCRAER